MRPFIALSADQEKLRDVAPAAAVYNAYIEAVFEGAGGDPWIFPPLGERLNMDGLLSRIDGCVLTGALSNVDPRRYGDALEKQDTILDPARDETTLSLIPRLRDAGVPVFAICRGYQELNVALGGTLVQHVHEALGMIDHRDQPKASWAERFDVAHDIEIAKGGVLDRIAPARVFRVNSLHHQGVARLADGLQIEAQSEDGLIEAASVRGAKAFALGVQWHPEWGYASHPLNRPIWDAFGEACRRRMAQRKG